MKQYHAALIPANVSGSIKPAAIKECVIDD
jgi:hypothetical protein